MTDLPKIVRERMRTAVAGDHPDPDVLAAFAEQALPERERTPLMDHLARCADCRDVLALAAVSAEAVATQTKDTADARKAPWFTFPMLRWGALAACLVIVSTAVLLRRDLKTSYVTKDERQEPAPMPPATSVDSAHAENATANRPTETKTEPLGSVLVPEAASSYVATTPKASREKSLVAHVPAQGRSVGALLNQPAAPAASGASPVLAKDLRDERQVDAARSAFALGVSNGSASTAPAPAPVPPGPPAPTNKNVPAPHLAANAQNYTTQTTEPLAQMVDAVNADSDKSEKKVEIPGRAKTAAAPTSAALAVAPSDELELQKSIAPALEASRARKELARSVRPESLRWNISSDGQLQRSADSGKSWQPVTVAEGATFRHLSYNGPDIWVGGAAGSLYHSSDAGGHWTQVKPVANGVSLSGDIAAIAFTDPEHGKITTTNGQTWSTSDGGQSWMQQP